ESSCSEKNKEISKELEGFEHKKININDIDQESFDKVDIIINFAAESHVDNSIYNPQLFIDTNVKGTAKVANYAIKNNIDKFIHISTDEVYGSNENDYSKENDRLNPSSPSSSSKAAAEMILNGYTKTYGYEFITVRPANNYGIFQQPEKLIPFSVANILSGNSIEIYGKGNNIRHWLHVDDTCSAIDHLIEKGKINEVYNIGSGFYLSNIELAKKLLMILDKQEDMIEFVEDRPGHDFRYAVNLDKISSTGWKPISVFDEKLEETVNWYQNNENWWKNEYENVKSNKRLKRSGLN
ncbi:MAG: GDP-mannose 4,6-dehydratase, partial [Bacteroidota bacterium]|nr:GDP-mannose 4,6-dehydratase [Bacteroidota bacterium]